VTIARRFGRIAGVAIVAALVLGVYFVIRDAGDLAGRSGDPNDILFKAGHAFGNRMTTRAWSVDYESAETNANHTLVDLRGVRNGVIFKDGKPYVRIKAAHVRVNTVTHDFDVDGGLHVEKVSPENVSSLDTTTGSWLDHSQYLVLGRPTTITMTNGETTHVQKVIVNIKTGSIHLKGIDLHT